MSSVVLLGCLVAVPVAYEISGSAGPIAAGTGAGLCLIGAGTALVITSQFRGPTAAMYSIVVGMFARALLPLFVGVLLHLNVPSLANAGMIFYLLVFYLAALATETVLLLAQVSRSSTANKAS